MKKALIATTITITLLGAPAWAKNPLFEHVFTSDAAALVQGDTVYLYTGHDEAPNNDVFFQMHDWLVFSSQDMKNARFTWDCPSIPKYQDGRLHFRLHMQFDLQKEITDLFRLTHATFTVNAQ